MVASCFSSHFSNPISHLVHASDADQLEALLTRWGPDGIGKLGGERSVFDNLRRA